MRTPVVVADDVNNVLIVQACPGDYETVERLVAELDTADAGAKPIKLIALKFTDAEEMRTILEDYLRKPGTSAGSRGGRRGGRGATSELVGDLRISANTQNNTLVLSGNAEQLEEVAEVVAQLDVETEDGGVQIIRLENAQASVIQPQLEELFEQQSRGGRRGSGGGIRPVIVANDDTNSLIVRAGPADFAAIERTVAQLDAEEGERDDVRIVQVAASINIEDMATKIEETFNAMTRSGGGRGRRGAQQQQLVVTPDKRTNSLILAGAPALFDDAEQLIRSLEKMGPQEGQRTVIIRTQNIDANDAQAVISDMIEDDTSSRGRRSSSRGSRPSRRGGGGRRR
jgi:type II secretory pathway component GspD/PulD (secretin)